MNALTFLSQKLLSKTFFVKTAILSFCSESLIVDLRSNLRSTIKHITEEKRALKELLNAFFRDTVALLVPELCAGLSKNVGKAKFDL